MNEIRERIARRVALELKDNEVVNLGIGLPTMVCDFIPNSLRIIFQSENGMIGMGKDAQEGQEDPLIINAGGKYVTTMPGAAFIDSATSFTMIRGGHVDSTVLGTLQVDAEGSIANWIIPGKLVPGMGGAMDLIYGARRVIVATEHCVKGKPKIVQRCTLPLTAYAQADLIVSEKAVFTRDSNGLQLIELAPDETVESIRACTDATFSISKNLRPLQQ